MRVRRPAWKRVAIGLWVAAGCGGLAGPGAEGAEKELTVQEQAKFDLGGGVSLELVLIRPGSFLMGEEKGAPDGADAKPVHKVTLSQLFFMDKYVVTQEQWEAVMGSNPSRSKAAKNPVEMVNWDDCQAFVKKLNEKFSGGKFRLPTEAEWEYACRAGSKTRFFYGDDEASLGDYAWYRANANKTTHPVGEKRPNAWGLYGMQGNVAEWCEDALAPYPAGEQKDPVAAAGGVRVIRGGSWGGSPSQCRSALRNGDVHYMRYPDLGFRVVFVPVP